MTHRVHRLATNYAKNYCNRTPIVKVIVENVVTCFFGTQCSSLATHERGAEKTGTGWHASLSLAVGICLSVAAPSRPVITCDVLRMASDTGDLLELHTTS